MTPAEGVEIWLRNWDRLDILARQARDPRLALEFCEGGALREEMEQNFFGLARLALHLPEVQREELLGKIGSVYRLEIPRLPSLSASMN